MSRVGRWGLAAVAALLVGAGWLAPPPPAPRPFAWSAAAPPPPGTRYSLFALGDTGEQHALPSLFEGQLAVARALTAHDLAAPVDALLLLGDNFYPDGLARSALAPRIAANLVWPYCRFVALEGPRSGEVRDACSLPEALRRSPAPRILAVLGDHDYALPESPDLERRAIPEFVSNWTVPAGPADVVALAPGLSLVLIDVPMARIVGPRAVTEAVRASPGPWRIVAAHNPIAPGEDRVYGRKLRRAVEEAGVPVQLYLSGHEHDLRVIRMDPPGPALHVISGGGATRKPIARHYVGERFARESTGFARVDLVADDGVETLVVSLYATPRYPVVFWMESQLLGRWSVSRDGAVQEGIASAPGRPAVGG